MTMVEIRHEQPEDIEAVRYVNQQAFETPSEAELVDSLRSQNKVILSLIAVDNSKVVGHILFSPVSIQSGDKTYSALGLGPMAVLPEKQRHGIGTLLVKAGLEECRRAGHECVFVVGHPKFYSRFGFTPASRYRIKCEFDVPDEAFMAAELRVGILKNRSGIVRYQREFSDI